MYYATSYRLSDLDEYQQTSHDSQPAKRSRTEDDSCMVHTPPPKVSKSAHDNPLDDNILDKRIGNAVYILATWMEWRMYSDFKKVAAII